MQVVVLALGPKASKVTVPVGALPPLTVAESVMAPPGELFVVAVVTIVGVALVTVEVSPASPQAVAAGALLASPL